MEKLKEGFGKIKEKFLSLSKMMRIGIVVLTAGIILALIFLGVYLQNNKYGVLFSNLDPNDAKVVTQKLTDKKVDTKVKGTSIYVPTDKVDELRLELATDITSGSKGYELMDTGSSLGMTDAEFQVKKQRALQGEVERTIKSFPQVENARVLLTPAEDSAFVKESKPGKASVYLQLKSGTKLEKEQVKSIVSLVSGATSNTPKENIEVIDDKMNLLSADLFDDKNSVSSSSLEKQKGFETDFDSQLEKAVLGMLEPVLGKDRVKVKIKSDLDFDAKEKTDVVVNPNTAVVSEATSKETSNDSSGSASQSPVDNNMTNSATNTNKGNVTSSKEDKKTNYEVGKSETKVISAPGAVKRISASVIVDGNLDSKSEDNVRNAVSAAIGFNEQRGDQISVIGMTFDPAQKDIANKAMEEMDKAKAEEEKMKWAKITAGLIALAILVIGGIVFFIIKRRRDKDDEEEEEEELEGNNLNVVIGDNVKPKEEVKLSPIDFEGNNEKNHVENELKRYAQEKPEQFAEVIKAWLAEDER